MHTCMNTESSADGSSAPGGAPNSCARFCTNYGWVHPYIHFLLSLTNFQFCFLFVVLTPQIKGISLSSHWQSNVSLFRAMASESLEDVLTNSGVDSTITNALMMEGWTCQTFRMAAADPQGFEEVLQEWSSSHIYFDYVSESLFANGLSITAASSGHDLDIGPSIDLYTTHGILGRGLSSEIGELSPLGHETEVHLKLSIRTSSCRCVPFYAPGKFGARSTHQEVMEMDSMEVSYLPYQVRRDLREQGTKNAQIGQLWSSGSVV